METLNQIPTNNICPFCHQPQFFEKKRSTLFVYWNCLQCGTTRKYSLSQIPIKSTDHNYFHIFQPFFSAWMEYGWPKNDWGIGLNCEKINFLAAHDEMVFVSYGKDKETKYQIRASKIKDFPVRPVKNTNVKLYIVPRSALKKVEKQGILL